MISRGRRALLLGLAAGAILLARAPSGSYLDFCSYYSAGRLAAAGEPEAAYDGGRLAAMHREVHPGGRSPGPFLYSPLYLLPARWLAVLPIESALRASQWLGAACLGLGLAALLRAFESLALQLAIAATFVVAHPVWVQLIYQNWTYALFLVLAVAGWAMRRERPATAELAWALALHLKVFFGFGLVALWVAGRRRVAISAVALAVFLSALSLPAVGVASWQRWSANLRHAESLGVRPFYNKVSVAATVARFDTEPRDWIAPRRPVTRPVVRWAMWIGLPFWLLGLHRLRRSPEAALAFTYAWILLAVPQIWDHTEIVLFLALPALAVRHRWLLVGLLAASAAYNPVLQPMLIAAARGDGSALAVRIFLSLFALLNLLVAAMALAARDDGETPAVAE